MYQNFIRPFLKKHEDEIEALVAKVQSQAGDVQKDLLEKAKNVSSTENMMKAAAGMTELKNKLDTQTSGEPQDPSRDQDKKEN